MSNAVVRVLDASALINVLAVETELARAILSSCGGQFVITAEVASEVLIDPRERRQPVAARLDKLCRGLIERVTLDATVADRFVELTMAMGDGEASVLAYAEHTGGIAVIDDADGRGPLATAPLEWSIDLFLDANVRERVGTPKLADSIYDAGTLARMRFPTNRHAEVIALLGEERARHCPGLQRTLRRATR